MEAAPLGVAIVPHVASDANPLRRYDFVDGEKSAVDVGLGGRRRGRRRGAQRLRGGAPHAARLAAELLREQQQQRAPEDHAQPVQVDAPRHATVAYCQTGTVNTCLQDDCTHKTD